jgi:cephalosporin hydroxylase
MMNIELLVDGAFDLGLQQIREEVLALASFVAGLQPRNVMEIGSASGGTFYLWCKIAAAGGKKISVDLPGGVYGGEPNADPVVRARRDEMMGSWAPGVYLVAGDSHQPETRAQVHSILGDEKLDFLFIDGDHTYEGVRADYFMYRDLVRSNGYIAFHDINDSDFHRANLVGVGRFWQEIEGPKVELNARQEWAGIGITRHV